MAPSACGVTGREPLGGQEAPRQAFSPTGEQIDGSFMLDGVTYLLEAKCKGENTVNRELAAFNDQVGSRAE